MTQVNEDRIVETDIPARLDRLPWARWHWLVVIALGTVWILDGLEVTIVGSIAGRLSEKGSGLELSAGQIGLAGSFYVAGACFGALFFGWLTDRLGRKRLFLWTLALYLVATVLTGFAQTAWWFYLMRVFTGMGIGGEYAAINSAIDELIPARVRGTVDIVINGSYWLGALFGALITPVLLDTSLFAANIGWRLAFGLGGVLGLVILFVRRQLPESPRWLYIHGHADEADQLVDEIEATVASEVDEPLPEPPDEGRIRVRQRKSVGFVTVGRTVFGKYPKRAVLGFSLFVGQAFLYNAILFTYTAILGTFFGVPADQAPFYLAAFAVGNFLGPLLLGRFFDSVGRRPMIASTYIGSGILLLVTAWLFNAGHLSALTISLCWAGVFFLASAGVSAAYLTVSEVFPLETRALSIALFYAIGTGGGGIIGPVLYGRLIDAAGTGKHPDFTPIAWGFAIGAILMVLAGLVEIAFGVKAERTSLEEVAPPISAEEAAVAPRRAGRRGGFSPMPSASTYGDDSADIEREIERLSAACREASGQPLSRRELYRRSAAARWGPGRFGSSLRAAVASGRVREVGHRFVLGDAAAAAPGGGSIDLRDRESDASRT